MATVTLGLLQQKKNTFLLNNKIPKTWEEASAEEVLTVMLKIAENGMMLDVHIYDGNQPVVLFARNREHAWIFFKLHGARAGNRPREFQITGEFVVFVKSGEGPDHCRTYDPLVDGNHLIPHDWKNEWISWNMNQLHPILQFHGPWTGQLLPVVAMSYTICEVFARSRLQ